MSSKINLQPCEYARKSSIFQDNQLIYKKTKGRLFYLSIDIESGGFEVFDSNYKHLGQYDFSGKKVKKAEPRSHKLKH